MQFYGVLVLLVTLSTACGLRCYECNGGSKSCEPKTCLPLMDSCSTTTVNGVTIKSCMLSSTCISPMKCCKEDLCNSAIPTGSSVFLLMISSAIITLFL
ncbi:CD59 glycoprotein-like isoform X1 [Morone saxatilis]|uniref:CD59 glycoprotein-like isoform X1 n=1 Tax=Morone saxatilis TaxID=34816 RepID=UPI0015E1BFC7|nr:CD59 glycoprotein-like isoform X1 [Morone saxatilis]